MFKMYLEKEEEPEIKMPTSIGSSKKQEFQKNIYFCFRDYAKGCDLCGSQQIVKNSKRDRNTRPPYCLLQNLYAGQEATVRIGHGTTDWLKIGKGVCQICLVSPCLFNLYADYIMQNARLDEAQARIKTARRNINNLRYADDTTFMAEVKEELKKTS